MLWNTTEDTGNFGGGPVFVTGYDTYGAFYDGGLTANPHNLGFIFTYFYRHSKTQVRTCT